MNILLFAKQKQCMEVAVAISSFGTRSFKARFFSPKLKFGSDVSKSIYIKPPKVNLAAICRLRCQRGPVLKKKVKDKLLRLETARR